jgi:tetratricopeptide (TPR) repeat protein
VIHWQEKRFDQSVPMFERLAADFRAAKGPRDKDTVRMLANLTINYHDAGRMHDASKTAQEFLDGYIALSQDQRSKLQGMRNTVAQVLEQSGNAAKAEVIRRDEWRLAETTHGNESEKACQRAFDVALNLLRQGRPGDAELIVRDIWALNAKRSPERWETRFLQSWLGKLLAEQRKFKEAESALLEAHSGLERVVATIPEIRRNQELVRSAERLVGLYEATDRFQDAEKWRQEKAKWLSPPKSETKKSAAAAPTTEKPPARPPPK